MGGDGCPVDPFDRLSSLYEEFTSMDWLYERSGGRSIEDLEGSWNSEALLACRGIELSCCALYCCTGEVKGLTPKQLPNGRLKMCGRLFGDFDISKLGVYEGDGRVEGK